MPRNAESDGPLNWSSIRDAAPSEPRGSDWSRKGGTASPKPRKLCIGAGEADGVTFAGLRAAFGAFGSLERVDLPAKKTYSFVEFTERSAASRAFAATNSQPLFGKRNVVVSYARSKTGDAPVDSSSPKLWVSGIGKDTRKADIEKIFGGFGKITRVDAPPGRDYAFVWFDRVEDSEMAKRALHNKPIDGSVVRVTYSNKPDGAPKGRPKPAAVAKTSPGRRESTKTSRHSDAGKSVSPQLTGDSTPSGPPTWSDLLSKAKQSRLATVVAFASVWSLWYDDPKGQPCVLGTFGSPAEFFDVLCNRAPRVLRGGSRLLLLRNGVPPSPRAVADSGQIMVHVPSADAPLAWFRLMETSVLEDLSFADKLPGVVLERTGGGQQGGTDTLVLWTSGLVDEVGVQTTQLAMAELRSALKLQADVHVTHQMHEPSTPTSAKSERSTLAGGDPSWSQLRGGGMYTPTGSTCGSGGRWSPLSNASSTGSSSSTSSHPATPLSTPLFIQRHSKPGQDATPGISVVKPPIQLRPSHGLRPFSSTSPASRATARASPSSPTASRNRDQIHSAKPAAVFTGSSSAAAQPDRGLVQRPEHLRLKLQKPTPKSRSQTVMASQTSQSQSPRPTQSEPKKPMQQTLSCSSSGRAGRLWLAAPVASGVITAAFGAWLYYAPTAAGLFA